MKQHLPSTSRRRGMLAIGASAFAPLFGATGARASGRPPVRVGGTGAGLVALQRLQDGKPGLQLVANLGSGGGIKAVLAGAIDLALASRPLTPAEVASGLSEHLLLRSPLLWAVHAAVAVDALDGGQLADLYAGRSPQWPDGRRVRLVLRPENDSETRYLMSLGGPLATALPEAHTRPGVLVATTDTDAIESIERIDGAIGVSSLVVVIGERRRVRTIAVDGTLPTTEALLSGRWPHVKQIYAVTRGRPAGRVADLLADIVHTDRLTARAAIGCTLAEAA